MQPDLDGALAHTEPQGDLCMWHVMNKPVDEYRAGLWREKRHGAVKERGELTPFHVSLEIHIVARRADLVAKRVLPIGPYGYLVRSLPAAALLPPPTHIARDSGQPPGAMIRLMQVVPVSVRLVEALLRQIFGNIRPAGERGAEADKSAAL
jgi:hypothetical protein